MADDTVSLKEYFNSEIENVKKLIQDSSQAAKDAVKSALDSQKEAILKSEAANEKRFASVNEFRNTLSDQQRNLMPRAEVDILVKALENKSESNEKRIITLESKGSGIGQGMGYVIGIVGVVSAITAIILAFFR
jgi:hypothetical protein